MLEGIKGVSNGLSSDADTDSGISTHVGLPVSAVERSRDHQKQVLEGITVGFDAGVSSFDASISPHVGLPAPAVERPCAHYNKVWRALSLLCVVTFG